MTAQRGDGTRAAAEHEHAWSDWYRLIFYRDSLGRLLPEVGIGRLGGAMEPETDGWVRACIVCNEEDET